MLRLVLGSALAMSRGYAASEVGETLAKARTLAEQLRPDSLIRLFNGMHYYYLVRSEHENALRVAQRMEEIVEGQDDLALSLMAHRQHGASRFYLGEFVVARALFRQRVKRVWARNVSRGSARPNARVSCLDLDLVGFYRSSTIMPE